VKGKVIPVL